MTAPVCQALLLASGAPRQTTPHGVSLAASDQESDCARKPAYSAVAAGHHHASKPPAARNGSATEDTVMCIQSAKSAPLDAAHARGSLATPCTHPHHTASRRQADRASTRRILVKNVDCVASKRNIIQSDACHLCPTSTAGPLPSCVPPSTSLRTATPRRRRASNTNTRYHFNHHYNAACSFRRAASCCSTWCSSCMYANSLVRSCLGTEPVG